MGSGNESEGFYDQSAVDDLLEYENHMHGYSGYQFLCLLDEMLVRNGLSWVIEKVAAAANETQILDTADEKIERLKMTIRCCQECLREM